MLVARTGGIRVYASLRAEGMGEAGYSCASSKSARLLDTNSRVLRMVSR